jgi:hypothetical protein
MIQHAMRLKRMDVRNLRTFWLVSCIFNVCLRLLDSACPFDIGLPCVWSASIHVFTTTDEIGR